MFHQLDLPTLQEYMGCCSINTNIKGNQLFPGSHSGVLGSTHFVLQDAVVKIS